MQALPPGRVAGSPEWNVRADLAGRAMRLISDGMVDREGVTGLARRLGESERQVNRAVTAELGAGRALARAQRAQTARVLTETTALPLSEIALASGFASIRQFNATIREVFAAAPGELRERAALCGLARRGPACWCMHWGARAGECAGQAAGMICLRLAYRPPIDMGRMLRFLARAIPGVETVTGGTYRRTINLPNGTGVIALRPAGDPQTSHIDCELQLQDLRDVAPAVQHCRRLFSLDPTRRRSPRSCPAVRCCGRPWPSAPGGGCPGTWTGTNWPSGRCSSSRCPWRPPAVSARG